MKFDQMTLGKFLTLVKLKGRVTPWNAQIESKKIPFVFYSNLPWVAEVLTKRSDTANNICHKTGFLELSCFFHDPSDVGNLISGSSAFFKTSLNIRKFTVHILLKPGVENFEHYFTSM